MVAWLSARSVEVFFVVLVVGFSWWLSAWVSLGDSCGGCFFVGFFFFFFGETFVVVVGSGFGGFFNGFWWFARWWRGGGCWAMP